MTQHDMNEFFVKE